ARTASVGFVTTMGRPMATSQDFVNWVCGPELLPEYLMAALMAARNWITEIPDGSTHKTIYIPVVERFAIAIPPIELQRKFAKINHGVERHCDRQVSLVSQSQDLLNSLVQRAFRGEL